MNRRRFIRNASGLLVPFGFPAIIKAASVPAARLMQAKSIQPISGAVVTNPFVVNQVLGTLRTYNGSVGMRFVTSSNITAKSLGRWVVSGNNQSHTLSLYDSGCVLLASCVVNCNGATPAQYLYNSIPDVSLTSGTTYNLMSSETGAGDQFYDADTTVTLSADGSSYGAIFDACVLNGPTIAYVPVNFLYTKP